MDIRVLSFTGSVPTGKLIQIAAAKSNLKNVVLELGGKSPAIVFEDADLAKAIKQTQFSIHFNSGQICMANSRIYVQESVFEKFLETYKKDFGDRTMGDPTDPKTNHGPQADELQHKRVLEFLEEGKKSGKLALGGEEVTHANGAFIQPTIFTNTPEDARIMKEEVFGPVVNINTFKTEEEVVAKANDSEFGLYASVYTKDVDRAIRIAKQLEAGTVGVNCTSPTTGHDMAFGGYKTSGVGREGLRYSMEHFLETKSVLFEYGDKPGH